MKKIDPRYREDKYGGDRPGITLPVTKATGNVPPHEPWLNLPVDVEIKRQAWYPNFVNNVRSYLNPWAQSVVMNTPVVAAPPSQYGYAGQFNTSYDPNVPSTISIFPSGTRSPSTLWHEYGHAFPYNQSQDFLPTGFSGQLNEPTDWGNWTQFPGVRGNALSPVPGTPGWGGPIELYAAMGAVPGLIPRDWQQVFPQFKPSAFGVPPTAWSGGAYKPPPQMFKAGTKPDTETPKELRWWRQMERKRNE